MRTSWSAAALALSVTIANAAKTAGCGSKLPSGFTAGGNSNTVKIKSDGMSRTYNLYIPENYKISTAAPLYFSYHGGSQNAENQEELSQLSNPEFNPDGIAVYPQGIDECWQGVPGCEGTDDVEFTSNIVDDISSSYCVDTTRIFASGKSDGGGFLGLLACNSTMSKTFAAFAPVSGAFYGQNSSMNCTPSRTPIPVLEFHGADDTVIPYEGGGRRGSVLPSIPDWLTLWATRDGDDAKNSSSKLYKGNVQVSTWKDMTQGYLIDGLGHAWPSTEPNLDNSQGTYLNATPIMLEFFANNTLSSASASSTPSAGASATTSLSTGVSTATGSASATAKSSASSVPLFTWQHTLFFLGFSTFFSFEILSIGLCRWSKAA